MRELPGVIQQIACAPYSLYAVTQGGELWRLAYMPDSEWEEVATPGEVWRAKAEAMQAVRYVPSD